MKIGNLTVHLLNDGCFRLDGGAMFGVVPRVMWERVKPPDERNRIRMGTQCLLVESGERLVLVDTGVGDKLDPKSADIFGLESDAERLPDAIRSVGFDLEDVTDVLLTHLHFDHSGWNTREEGGKLIPTFPLARYWMERGEVEHARSPNVRDRASYDARNWEPLFEAGVVELFDDQAEPAPGVKAHKAPGHNADMCVVHLESGEDTAVFLADLVPTPVHVPAPWIMGFDLYPMDTLKNKQIWLRRAFEGKWLCIFQHEDLKPLGRIIERKPGSYRAESVEPASSLAGRSS